MKKEIDGDLEMAGHPPASPPKLRKRKRRQSRTLSESSGISIKEKRKLAVAAAAEIHQQLPATDAADASSQPSTSGHSGGPVKPKKKKILKTKRLLPKKKRSTLDLTSNSSKP